MELIISLIYTQARKLLPNGEEAGLGIVPSKQRSFEDYAKSYFENIPSDLQILQSMYCFKNNVQHSL